VPNKLIKHAVYIGSKGSHVVRKTY